MHGSSKIVAVWEFMCVSNAKFSRDAVSRGFQGSHRIISVGDFCVYIMHNSHRILAVVDFCV